MRSSQHRLVTLPFSQDIAIFLKRTSDELIVLPQVRGQEAIGIADRNEGSFEGVLEGLGAASG